MITFQVDDMTCGHCVSMITKAVRAADQKASVNIDLASHRVDIEPTEATAQQLPLVIGRGPVFAERRAARHAGQAVIADGYERKHDVITHGQIGHVRPQFNHFTGGFVAQHHRHLAGAVAVDDR